MFAGIRLTVVGFIFLIEKDLVTDSKIIIVNVITIQAQ